MWEKHVLHRAFSLRQLGFLFSASMAACGVCRQTAYLIVDETHAALPEIARDQYWDELKISLPYTVATQQTRRDEYTATADNIELVTCDSDSHFLCVA